MKHIWYIHGANATPASFTYLKTQFPDHQITDITYDASTPIEITISRLASALESGVDIVAHSLGGVLGVALAQRYPSKVRSVTTMSTPFGGSETASKLRFLLPFNTFISNVHCHNRTLREVAQSDSYVPTLKFITTAGRNPFELQPNDGVVTVRSQEAFRADIAEYVELNHFEVLLDHVVAGKIRKFIFND